jgi:hypothetical protein
MLVVVPMIPVPPEPPLNELLVPEEPPPNEPPPPRELPPPEELPPPNELPPPEELPPPSELVPLEEPPRLCANTWGVHATAMSPTNPYTKVRPNRRLFTHRMAIPFLERLREHDSTRPEIPVNKNLSSHRRKFLAETEIPGMLL